MLQDIFAFIWTLIYRIWLIAETTIHAYPDPFLHVETRCARLRLPKSVRPRKMTLVLDLDETLVHSSQKQLAHFDWKVRVTAGDNNWSTFFVAKRPHAELFLRAVSKWYEVVVFTASLQHYADPVIDLLDPQGYVARRYFRASCVQVQGNFVKDLSAVRRDLSQVVIVDNSPVAYSLHTDNALPIDTWLDDPNDDALLNLLPILAGLVLLNDVRSVLSLRTAPPASRRLTA